MNPRDADHRDLKLAANVARMTIASGLRYHEHTRIINPEEGATLGLTTAHWRQPAMTVVMTNLDERHW